MNPVFLGNPYGQCIVLQINVKERDHIELLGLTIDKHLGLKKHIENLYQNATYKLHKAYKKIFNYRQGQTT